MQKYSSKNTSINSHKIPAIYKMKKAVELYSGKKVFDCGGGKFDTAVEFAKQYNAVVDIYDPFNRSLEHNNIVLNKRHDIAILSNVLNVIDSDTNLTGAITLCLNKCDTVLITVYEGNKSGIGRETKKDCYQRNQPLQWYVDYIKNDLILNHFARIVYHDKKLIILKRR